MKKGKAMIIRKCMTENEVEQEIKRSLALAEAYSVIADNELNGAIADLADKLAVAFAQRATMLGLLLLRI